MSDKPIKETFIDPLGIKITLYEQTWDVHIIEGHPEMVNRYSDVKATIQKPDCIREGRKPATEKLYVKQFVSDALFVSTRRIGETETIVTSSYEGQDRESRGKIIWSK